MARVPRLHSKGRKRVRIPTSSAAGRAIAFAPLCRLMRQNLPRQNLPLRTTARNHTIVEVVRLPSHFTCPSMRDRSSTLILYETRLYLYK